jgi:hypothetical protein
MLHIAAQCFTLLHIAAQRFTLLHIASLCFTLLHIAALGGRYLSAGWTLAQKVTNFYIVSAGLFEGPHITIRRRPAALFHPLPYKLHTFSVLSESKSTVFHRRLSGTSPDQGSLAWHHNLNQDFLFAAKDHMRPFFWRSERNFAKTQSVDDNHCECGLADIYEHRFHTDRQFAPHPGTCRS